MRGSAITIVLLVTMLADAWAQYRNDWIDYDQEYLKVKVGITGIYRVEYNDILTAGYDPAIINTESIQLYKRGEEIAIRFSDTINNTWESGEFLEFYGVRNDGTLDRELYVADEAQVNPYVNLYSDTSIYFLTWNNSGVPGKRISEYLIGNPSLSPETISEVSIIASKGDRYARGDNINFNSFLSAFDYGEGYSSGRVREGNSLNFSISGITEPSTGVGDPTFRLSLLGESENDHQNDIYAGPDPSNLRLLGTDTFSDFQTNEFTATLNWSDISPVGDLHFRIDVLGSGGLFDQISTPWQEITYPWNFNIDGAEKTFSIIANPGGLSYLEITNADDTYRLWDITDEIDVRQVGYTLNGNVIEAIVQDTETERELYLFNQTYQPGIEPVDMNAIPVNSTEFLIITHKSLRNPSGLYSDPISEYATYRNSTLGGGYDTLTINIEDLYNQFSYGEISPAAVYSFIDYLSQSSLPAYLLIIGKGLRTEFNYHRNPGAFTFDDLVPPAGNPGSDLLYAVAPRSGDEKPRFPVGRVPASTPQEVENYLEKVKTMESLPYDDLWRKDILHLSGGITASEQANFFLYMERWRGDAEDVYLGADVKTIRKNTVENVTFINISEEINKGTNLVTFFGHSNPNVTDIDVGAVSDPVNGYDNDGRYPIFLVNGCEAGLIYNNKNIWGEDWILDETGAVAFIAHSSYALSGILRAYSGIFYETYANDSSFINQGIGDIQLHTIHEFIDLFGQDTYWNVGMAHQMLLMGDPAYRPFAADQPDYAVGNISINSFDNLQVSAQSDSFALEIVIDNYGLAIRDSLLIRVEQQTQNGDIIVYDSLFPPVLYRDTLSFKITRKGKDFSGNNRFLIDVDPDFALDELNEINNQAEFEFFIPLNGTFNIIPAEFSIASIRDLSLYFQSTNILEPSESIDIEVDTSAFFDSPYKMDFSYTGEVLGKVDITLLPDQPENDSTVYYWRTRLSDPFPGESEDWRLSSFTYMKDSPEGWSQSDFYQLVENQLIGLVPDSLNKIFRFTQSSIELNLTTYGATSGTANSDVSVRIDDLEYIINNSKLCRWQTTNLIAFDRKTALPYAALPFPFQNSKTCGRQPQVINSFSIQELDGPNGNLIDYIDAVNTGDTVVVFNVGRPLFSLFPDAVRNKFAELGVDPDLFLGLGNNDPFVIVGVKGGPVGSAEVYLSDSNPPSDGSVNLIRRIYGSGDSGRLTTPRIGPGNVWGSFSQDVLSLESPSDDQFSFDIFGVDANSVPQELFIDITNQNTDLSTVDPDTYGNLVLEAELSDESDQTPPQIDVWTVLFDYPPEGVLLTDLGTDPIQATEGETVTINFAFINISDKIFPDSLLVQYRITSRVSNQSEEFSFRIQAPAIFDTTNFKVDINTLSRGGANDIFLEVNPAEFREQEYSNNSLTALNAFEVKVDEIRPRVEIVVDGRRILDGEIVSPSPLVRVSLADENKVRVLSDTSFLDVFYKVDCPGCEFEKLPYSSSQTQFEAPDSEGELVFEHQFTDLQDGVYFLRVEARDASGNSQDEPFELSFEVINESAVSNFYPYPNPFSDQMRFIFTITGEDVPDDISVRIMTLTGKVVREIDGDELGPLNIGNNISDFRWDGTDEYGERLANGVYLYQVRVEKDGQSVPLRETAGDRGFKNGLGKIYLLR